LWCWFSSQWANMNPALPRLDSYLSWFAILGGECRCWSNIRGVLLVSFQWLILYMARFSANSIVCCACKIISSGVINIIEVLSMTNSTVIFPMVYSDLAINA
jgi:hypothetical protein